ncbi:MAG TPA: cupin domain-containing protein [Rhizomicrobium sp.]|nr:cupin domain-containing protein [Rhizomicrobium sp.]
MKTLLAAALLLAPLPAYAQSATPPTKLYGSAADVQALIASARANHKGGNTVRIVANVPGYPVQLEYRTGTTPPSIHPTQDEFIEVIGGGCTLVTGGTLTGVTQSAAGAKTLTATAIEGGSPRKVTKGDYIFVPANTPHQYTEIQGELITVAVHMPVTAK